MPVKTEIFICSGKWVDSAMQTQKEREREKDFPVDSPPKKEKKFTRFEEHLIHHRL